MLFRSISDSEQVQLSHEQFERLYLQSGGVAAKGDLTKRFANPYVFAAWNSLSAQLQALHY